MEFIPVIVNIVRLKSSVGVPEIFPFELLNSRPVGSDGVSVNPSVTVEMRLPYLMSELVLSRYVKWTPSFESMAREEYSPTSPDESSVESAHEPLVSVAYLRSSLLVSKYKRWMPLLESWTREVKKPTSWRESRVVLTHEPLLSVAYLRSRLLDSR